MPDDLRGLADLILQRALAVMEERGVPRDVALDRLTTYAAGAHVDLVGSDLAAECFRKYAEKIEAGLFDAATAAKVRH